MNKFMPIMLRLAQINRALPIYESVSDHPAIRKFASIQHEKWRQGYIMDEA